MTTEQGAPRKILCLHGFCQDGRTFAEKMAVLRKKLTKLGYELDFLEGPLRLTKAEIPFAVDEGAAEEDPASGFVKFKNGEDRWLRGWFKLERDPVAEADMVVQAADGEWRPRHGAGKCDSPGCPSQQCEPVAPPPGWYNLELALGYLRERFRTHGPYDGIIGFSMGGCITNAILCSTPEALPVKWFVTISSRVLGGRRNELLKGSDGALRFQKPNADLPVLIVAGTNDQLVRVEQTRELREEWFPNATVVEHEGGHYIPSKNQLVSQIVTFITNHSA